MNPVDVVVVGAGLGGLGAAIRLRRAGRTCVVLEKGAEVGGTWRDNTYPGAACDVPSHLYSFSFAPKPDWSRRYAGWREIRAYTRDLVDRFDLHDAIRLGREVVAVRFDEATATWTVEAATGERFVGRAVILATGPLHHPHVPDIPGLSDFPGPVFHSARWRHDVDLRGKVVATVGTGASAIQFVPEVAKVAGRVHVFQRTPAWVLPRDDRAYRALEKLLFTALPPLRVAHRAELYWRHEANGLVLTHARVARAVERLARLHIRRSVRDPDLVRKLTPTYTIGCKRILLSDDWYPTFARNNVELVTERIAAVRDGAVITDDGRARSVDAIVLGTGFQVDPRTYMKIEVVGRGGRRLADDWAPAPRAHYGITVPGYPGLFHLVGPNTGLGHNSILFMIEAQIEHVLGLLDLRDARGAAWVDVRPEALERFDAEVQRALRRTAWATGCRSWYLDSSGRNFSMWPWSTWWYWLCVRRPRPDDFVFGPTTGAR